MIRLTSYLAACAVLTKAGSSENTPAALSADTMIHSVATSLKKKQKKPNICRLELAQTSGSSGMFRVLLAPGIHEIVKPAHA